MTKKVRDLKKIANIDLISFPFENYNKRTIKSKKPSELTCDSTLITADSDLLISNTDRSEIFNSIEKIIGKNNYNDIRHIDTAYKEKCKLFITPDKGDIVNYKENLEKITGIKFFYCEDIEEIKNYLFKMQRKL